MSGSESEQIPQKVLEDGVRGLDPDPVAAIVADWYSKKDLGDRVDPER